MCCYWISNNKCSIFWKKDLKNAPNIRKLSNVFSPLFRNLIEKIKRDQNISNKLKRSEITRWVKTESIRRRRRDPNPERTLDLKIKIIPKSYNLSQRLSTRAKQ